MEKINAALDAFCIIICIFLISHLAKRKTEEAANRCFLFACVFNITMILGDLTDWCCNGLARPWYPAALHIGQFVYYVSIVPLMLSMWKYVALYVSAYTPVPKIYDRLLWVLSGLHLLGCVLTPFTGAYYVITPENIYQRGEFVFAASVTPVCIYIMLLVLTWRNRKVLSRHVAVALLSYVWLPLLGQLVQNLFRGVGTLSPSITLALLLMFLNVHLEQELLYERSRRELDQAQMTLMLSQIRPHFLYNSLTAIRRLCDVDPMDAKAAINDFSLFLRANMESITDQRPIPFAQELEHTRSYLNLEQRRFDDLTVDYELEATDFCLPALTLQPVVENAVVHGVRKKEGGGAVTIRTSENESCFIITVEDDGAGFDPEAIADQPNIGLTNVSRRLELLCGGTLRVDSVPGNGTTATIQIPKEREGGSNAEISRGR